MSRETVERWERILDYRVPDRENRKLWYLRVLAVCMTLILVSNTALILRSDSLVEMVHPAAQIVFWMLFLGVIAVMGGFMVDSAEEGSRPGFGRRLRILCTFAILIFFPFYAAAVAGNFVAEPGGYSWASGLLVGGGVGIIFTLIFCSIFYYRYRKYGGS